MELLTLLAHLSKEFEILNLPDILEYSISNGIRALQIACIQNPFS